MKVKYAAVLLVVSFCSGLANAQVGGTSSKSSFGCKSGDDRGAITIACAGLEVSEQGCPKDCSAEGEYCISRDGQADYPVLVRNVCPEGFDMVGRKCTRSEAFSEE